MFELVRMYFYDRVGMILFTNSRYQHGTIQVLLAMVSHEPPKTYQPSEFFHTQVVSWSISTCYTLTYIHIPATFMEEGVFQNPRSK